MIMPDKYELIGRRLINKVENINIDELPPVNNLIIFGRPVEQLPRELLIKSLYIMAGQLAKLSAEGKV